MIGKDSCVVQVVISKSAKKYIEEYISLFGGSLSAFCASAINDKIINGVSFEKVACGSSDGVSGKLCDKTCS